MEFDPWGAISHSEGPAVAKRHLYTGKEQDETGLYFYAWRYYDPQLGRFLQPDTIVPNPRNPQDLNRYTYAGNNPIIYTDPTGHFKFKDLFKKTWFKFTVAAVIGIATAGWLSHLPYALTEGLTLFNIAMGAVAGASTYGGMTAIGNALGPTGLSPPVSGTGLQQGLLGETPLGYTTSFAAGFIPGLGEATDAYAALSGIDPFTGEELIGLERFASGVGFFIPVLGVSSIRQGLRGVKTLIGKEAGLAPRVVESFRDLKVRRVVLEHDVIVHRYFGGEAPEFSHWFTTRRTASIIHSPEEAQRVLKLDPKLNLATDHGMFIIPKDTVVNVGRTEGSSVQRATQLYVEDISKVRRLK